MSNIMHLNPGSKVKCPDWCETNHEVDPDGGHDGPSWPDVPSVLDDGYSPVAIGSCYDEDTSSVVVTLDADRLALTPDQAHTAGLALLSAASWAKDHQVSE